MFRTKADYMAHGIKCRLKMAVLEAKIGACHTLKELEKVAAEIGTTVDEVYATRYDCIHEPGGARLLTNM